MAVEYKAISLNAFREFFPDDGETLPVETAYHDVGYFRRAIDIRRDALSHMPYAVYRNETEVATEAPTEELVPELDILPLLDYIATDLDMFGAFYAVYETNAYNRNGAWRRLHPKTIRPKYDNNRGLTGFKRTIGSSVQDYGLDDIFYIWQPNQSAELGPGPGQAHSALKAATVLSNIEVFNAKFFENGALNPTILTIKNFSNYAQTDQERVRGLFDRLMSGVRNAFKIIPLGEDVQAVNLMQPLRDMALSELTQSQRETIATTLGIPQSLLMSNAANFATATQDDLNFYDKAIVPFCHLIERQLNERLFKPAGYRFEFQPQRLEVYQQLESSKADKLNAMLDRNVIDIAEYRELMGLPPRDDLTQPAQIEVRPVPPQLLQEQNDQPDSAADEMAADNLRAISELRTWLKVSKKRMAEGRYEKAAEFKAEYIPAMLQDNIREQLGTALDPDQVHAIFADAISYMDTDHAGH